MQKLKEGTPALVKAVGTLTKQRLEQESLAPKLLIEGGLPLGTVKELAAITPTHRRVLVQKWEESERGWGTRPDGYSIHKNQQDLDAYLKKYWDQMPKGEAPDEYSRPDGRPYEAVVGLIASMKLDEPGVLGIRINDNSYPLAADGKQGPDGWRAG